MSNTDLSKVLPGEILLSGPYSLFKKSFTIQYLKPHPLRNASVLMHITYSMFNPETHLGKKFSQSPPLHIHFDQTESFVVLQGRVGTTLGYECVDKIWDRENTKKPVSVEPWTPHTFWPVPPEKGGVEVEDAIVLIWAHPITGNVPANFVYPTSMDHWFFMGILGHVSDVQEGKEKLDILWLMLTQQESRTANVMLPTWYFLGPLRWLIPYGLQATLAMVARLQGKTALLEKYIGRENFEQWQATARRTKIS